MTEWRDRLPPAPGSVESLALGCREMPPWASTFFSPPMTTAPPPSPPSPNVCPCVSTLPPLSFPRTVSRSMEPRCALIIATFFFCWPLGMSASRWRGPCGRRQCTRAPPRPGRSLSLPQGLVDTMLANVKQMIATAWHIGQHGTEQGGDGEWARGGEGGWPGRRCLGASCQACLQFHASRPGPGHRAKAPVDSAPGARPRNLDSHPE